MCKKLYFWHRSSKLPHNAWIMKKIVHVGKFGLAVTTIVVLVMVSINISLTHAPCHPYGHDHVEVDGCPRGGGENGRRNIWRNKMYSSMRTGNIGYIQIWRRFPVVVVISRNASTREILRKLLYANDLAVVADSEADLQERLVDWKERFNKHLRRINFTQRFSFWAS